MKPDIEALRKKYMDNPPEGMTSQDIRIMSEDALLSSFRFLGKRKAGNLNDFLLVALWLLMQYSSFSLPQ